MTGWHARAGVLIYRVLLLAYPRAFRRAHGREAADTFRLLLRDTQGLRARSVLWLRTIRSVVTDGLRERRAPAVARPSRRLRVGAGLWRLLQSVRTGARQWARSPIHALVASVSLALGVGVSVAVVNVMLTLFVHSAVPGDAGRLHVLGVVREGVTTWSMPPALVDELSTHATTFDSLAAGRFGWAWVTAGGQSVELEGEVVTFNYFDVLGLTPAAGRLFHTPDRLDMPPHSAAVISYRLWLSHFAGAPDAVGRSIDVNGRSLTVLGVAPPAFRGPFQGLARDIWVPHDVRDPNGEGQATALFRRGGNFEVFGSLAAGTAPTQAASEFTNITAGLGLDDSGTSPRIVVEPVRGVHPAQRGDLRDAGTVALAVAAALLALTCLNLGGLLYARHVSRQRELAIRSALGGTRRGLVAQLCAENLAVAAGAGLISLAATTAGQRLITAWFAYQFPGLAIPLSLWSAGLAVGLTLLVVVAFTLVPAILSTRQAAANLNQRHPLVMSPRAGRWQATLAIGQVALSLMLVTGGFVMAQSVSSALAVGGNDAGAILHFRLRPSRAAYTEDDASAYFRRVLQALSNFELVESATLVRVGTSRGWCCPIDVSPAGEASPLTMSTDTNSVTPGFFDLVEIPIESGRAFDDADTPTSEKVAIVNRALAQRLWPTAPAVGQRLHGEDGDWMVIGVAANSHPTRPGEDPIPFLYQNFWQAGEVDGRLLVRVRDTSAVATGTIQSVLFDAGADVHVGQVGTLADRLALEQAPQLALMNVLRASATAGILLSALGLYSLLAISVTRRRRDDAVRLALGASRLSILSGVLTSGLWILGPGIAIGLGLAIGEMRMLGRYLYGIREIDPLLLSGAALVLLVVGLATIALPARRAALIDPSTILRG